MRLERGAFRLGATAMTEIKYFVEAYGSKSEVLEVFESFSGWYWFVTETNPEPEDSRIKFGLVYGAETEWGYFSMEELDPLIKRGKIWRVNKPHWFGISHLEKEVIQ